MKVVFMGTPDFAVPCLERLITDGENVVGVFTQPDKPVGRKQVLTPSAVKVCAQNHNLPVFQPKTLKNGEALEIIKLLNPDLIVVTAYGKILPKEILDFPQFGCINIHASLLPKYRGSAPIQWCIINGDTVTGVTSMKMDEGLDTGDMLLKAELEIDENETAGELFDRLMVLGGEVLSETLISLRQGTLKPKKQDENEAVIIPMLDKSISPIDWNKSAFEIHNKVRGLNPWPVATFFLDDNRIKLYKTKIIKNIGGKAGEVAESEKRLVVSCGDENAVEIISLQPEGKKQMSAVDFLRGHKIPVGSILR